MVAKSPIFLSSILNAFFLLLYLAFCQIRFGSLDDYFMSAVLTGAYGGNYDIHLYFVNAAYGYFLKPFYWLFPKVGWYFIFELAGTFAAFTSFSYFTIRKLGLTWGCVVSALFLATLTPVYYFTVGFTQCATIYTAAGILHFVYGTKERKNKFLVLGGIFLVAGSIMRYEGFLLGVPYLLLLLGMQVIKDRKWWKISIVTLVTIFTIIGGLREYNRSIFSEGDFKYYAAYQPIRAYFGDGGFYDKEAVYDELEERGMSGPDFYFLKGWNFYDTEVFNIDSLNAIRDVAQNNLYQPNPKRMLVAFLMTVSNAFVRPTGWCWLIICVLLILGGTKRGILYPWFSFGMVGFSLGYLLWVNRLVDHVESGIWMYAIASAVPLLQRTWLESNQVAMKWKKFIYGAMIAVACIFAAIGISGQEFLKTKFSLIETPKLSAEWSAFVKYTQEHPNDAFLLSFERYKTLGMYKNPAYRAIEPGSWNNIFPLGYWNIHLPAMKEELRKRGVENPLRDITHNNVYLIEDGNNPSLMDYYERHYHKIIKGDTVWRSGDLLLFSYRALDSLEGENHE